MTVASGNHRWWILVGSCLATLMYTVDVSIVNVALPILTKEFRTSLPTIQWVILSYVLVVTSLELGAARMGDIWGRKRLFLLGIAIFTVASILCASAGSIEQLILFRALEGIGGVFLAALGIAVATSGFPEAERGRALGLMSSVSATGIALGPTIGGFLIAAFGWRSIFWVNLPIGILAFLILYHFLKTDRYPAVRDERFDYWGCFTFALSLSALVLALTMGQHQGFQHPLTLSFGVIALISLGFFIHRELSTPDPMLNLQVFRTWALTRSILGNLLVSTIAWGGLFILPFFYTLVVGFSPHQVGLLLAIPPVTNTFVSPLSGWAVDRVGDRPIALFGLMMFASALWGISQFSANTPIPMFVATLIPYGMGLGCFLPVMNTVIMSHIPRENAGIGSGLISLALTLGQLLGTPLLAILVFLDTHLDNRSSSLSLDVSQLSVSQFEEGFAGAYHICIGLIFMGMVMVAVRHNRE